MKKKEKFLEVKKVLKKNQNHNQNIINFSGSNSQF